VVINSFEISTVGKFAHPLSIFVFFDRKWCKCVTHGFLEDEFTKIPYLYIFKKKLNIIFFLEKKSKKRKKKKLGGGWNHPLWAIWGFGLNRDGLRPSWHIRVVWPLLSGQIVVVETIPKFPHSIVVLPFWI
jgi:hypothetical protein